MHLMVQYFWCPFAAPLSLNVPGEMQDTTGFRHKALAVLRAAPVTAEDSFCAAPGLLRGATDEYFTSSLFESGELDDFQETMKNYARRGGFWEVAEKCAERKGMETEAYVSQIVDNAKNFKKANELAHLGEVVEEIERACESKGMSMLLSGRDNEGESFIVRKVIGDSNRNRCRAVAWAEMRGEDEAIFAMERELPVLLWGTIFVKILCIIGKDMGETVAEYGKNIFRQIIAGEFPKIEADDMKSIAKEGLVQRMRREFEKMKQEMKFVEILVEDAEKNGNVPVLIINEATLLARNPVENSKFMGKVVSFAGQNRLSAILESSTPDLPFLLIDNFGYRPTWLPRTIFVGELSPGRMRHILVENWGMDPELAHYCLGVYGGHIFKTYRALDELLIEREWLSAFSVASADIPMDLSRCLHAEDGSKCSLEAVMRTIPQVSRKEDLAGMKDILRGLAARGFVPLGRADDVIARVLAKYNIAAVVDKESFVFGLDQSLWDETSSRYALVPSSQFTRMIIACELNDGGFLQKKEHMVLPVNRREPKKPFLSVKRVFSRRRL